MEFYSRLEYVWLAERSVVYWSGKIKDVDPFARTRGKQPAFGITFHPSVNVILFDLFTNPKNK